MQKNYDFKEIKKKRGIDNLTIKKLKNSLGIKIGNSSN